jgi:hypothetical protein
MSKEEFKSFLLCFLIALLPLLVTGQCEKSCQMACRPVVRYWLQKYRFPVARVRVRVEKLPLSRYYSAPEADVIGPGIPAEAENALSAASFGPMGPAGLLRA